MSQNTPKEPASYYEIIPISKIEIWNEANTRHTEITEGVDELAQNISEIGLLEPPIVQKENGKYKLIMGQRRLLAVQLLGWKKIPVRVLREPLDLMRAKLASLSENLHRKPVTPNDLANATEYFKKKFGSDTAAAKALGVSVTIFRKYLGYEGVPEEIKALVAEKIISVSDAKRLFERVSDIPKAIEFARKIEGLPKLERERYFSALRENPNASLSSISERAFQLKYRRVLKIHLPEIYVRALDKASTYLNMEPEDVGETAIIEWLEKSGYVM